MRSTSSRRKKFLKTDNIVLSVPFNRLNDVYIKYVLGSPERKHIAIAFINAVLSHSSYGKRKNTVITDIEFLDRENPGEYEESKGSRFDILARSSDGRIFHIEIQVGRETFFMQRSFFYVAEDFITQIQRGESYATFKPVIYIGIMDFRLFGDSANSEDWYTLHKVMDVKTHEETLPEVEFHMVELPLLRRHIEKLGGKPRDELEELLCYFGNIGGEKLMEEIAERNPTVEELVALEKVWRMDPWTVRNYILNEHDRVYRENLVKYERGAALQEGLEEGRKEGFDEGRKSLIRKMRAKTIMTDEQIADMLNLPLDFVKNA